MKYHTNEIKRGFLNILAPSGPPSNVELVVTTGTSLKLTWLRPNDYLSNYDYPFNYSLCISYESKTRCHLADKGFQYTFRELQPLTEYFITIHAKSLNMSGEAFNLTASTIEIGKTHIFVSNKLMFIRNQFLAFI